MDFHLEVCKEMTVEEAHHLADSLEKRIERDIPGADVIIHIEPCRVQPCPKWEHCCRERTRPASRRRNHTHPTTDKWSL